MTQTEFAGKVTPDEAARRAANRKIVEQYMNTRGQDRLSRHLVFTEDGTGGLWTTETGEPIDGAGTINYAGYPEGFYRNHFLHSFRFRDGKILQQREFMNRCQQFRALGIAVPEVRREGIPT